MKKTKLFIVVTLALVTNSVFGQTTTINYNTYVRNFFSPQLKIVNDNLLFTTPVGVYFITLPHEYGSTWFEAYPYAFRGIAVNDFVVNEDKMLAAQTNNVGHILVMTEGNDTRNHILFTPQEFIPDFRPDDLHSMFYECFDVVNCLAQNPNDKNELFATISGAIMQSKDFGKTWIKIEENAEYCRGNFYDVKYSPLNSDIIIALGETNQEDIGSDMALYTTDGGTTWDILGGMQQPKGIAFHPTDADMVVVSGLSVAVSRDGCKTWEYTKDLSDLSSGPTKIAFDERTGETLYAKYCIYDSNEVKFGIYYSSDLGATWQELCDLPFESELVDFIQYGNKIYCISSECEICEIDLENTNVGVSEVITNDAIRINVGENAIGWQSEKMISRVEVISADGIILIQQEIADTEGKIQLGDELKGIAIVAFYTADGERITRKINL